MADQNSIQGVAECLRRSMSMHPEERKAAEAQLKQFQTMPGHLMSLLTVICTPGMDAAIAQAASIYFKNAVNREWDDEEEDEVAKAAAGGAAAPAPTGLPEEDKAAVRAHMLEGIICAPPLIRKQLAEAFKAIAANDYPAKWPGLLPAVVANLSSPDQVRVYGALMALRILTRKYEFKCGDDRDPLSPLVAATFPVLLGHLQALLGSGSAAPECAELIKLVLKCFWSACYLSLPAAARGPAALMPWMAALHALLTRPVPLDGQPSDETARADWPWWKAIKWALHIVVRLLSRYGDAKHLKPDPKRLQSSDPEEAAAAAANLEAAQVFLGGGCAARFLEACLGLMAKLGGHGGAGGGANGAGIDPAWLPPRVLNLALQYLTASVKSTALYRSTLRPHLDGLLYGVVFPLLCFSAEDASLWERDAHEYVRRGYDIFADVYSPKTAAMSFVEVLVRVRAKEHLQPFLQHAVAVFNEASAAGNGTGPESLRLVRRKDGAMYAVGHLADSLKVKSPYRESLPAMLSAYVAPEFASRHGHMRALACWVAGQYADLEFEQPAHFNALMAAVVAALRDAELPVRVSATVALRAFVEASEDVAALRPILPDLLNEFFRLMAEVESEDLLYTLESIVEKFGEEITPYALGLTSNLADAFWKLVNTRNAATATEDDDDDDNGTLAAVGCLRALATILESVSSQPELYPVLEERLLPIIRHMLTTEGQDVYEEILEIMSYITYYGANISPGMWSTWPLLVGALHDWALDYLDNALVPLDNFVSKGTEVFLTQGAPPAPGARATSYLEDTYALCRKVLLESVDAEPLVSDDEAGAAPKLLESVLVNCRGRVDAWVDPYINLAVLRLRAKVKYPSRGFQDLLVGLIASSLYYNASLAVSALQRQGALGEVLTRWSAMIFAGGKFRGAAPGAAAGTAPTGRCLHFRSERGKKVCALGLVSLLVVPAAAMPPEVAAGAPLLLQGVVKLLVDLKELIARNKELADAEDEDEEDGDGGDDIDSGGDDDGADDDDAAAEDSAYLKRLAKRDIAFEEDDGDDDDDDWDGEEDDDDYSSPLDEIDPYIFFADSMAALQAGDAARADALTRALNFSQMSMLQGMLSHANVRRAEIAAAAAKEAAKEAAKQQQGSGAGHHQIAG